MDNIAPLTEVPVDAVAVADRVARFTSRSIKQESKLLGLETIVSMTDLTTLEGADSPGRVRRLCQKAIRPSISDPSVPSVAAVCLYPNLIGQAKEFLAGSTVSLASVATGFPAGQVDMKIREDDTKQALAAGADEIDMVISRGAWLAGDEERVFDEIVRFKEICGKAHLKVILEVGELETFDAVRRASLLAMAAGGDFVKTSTGKTSPAASLAVTLVMMEAVRDFYHLTGKKVGIKPAGGIASAKEALAYLVMLAEVMGPDWVDPHLFRFGASSLLNDVLRQISKQKSGVYEGGDYVTQS